MENAVCLWYISPERPECGEPATDTVRVKGKVTRGSIPVCPEHKAQHDDHFAKLRTGNKR